MVGAVEDLRCSFLLVAGRVPQELGPAMFTKNPIKVWVVPVDFNDNRIAGLVVDINIVNDQIRERCCRQGARSYHKLAYVYADLRWVYGKRRRRHLCLCNTQPNGRSPVCPVGVPCCSSHRVHKDELQKDILARHRLEVGWVYVWAWWRVTKSDSNTRPCWFCGWLC